MLLDKKQRLGPKLEGGWDRGASKKIWDPLHISATVEASNFKFGTQLGFGTSLQKNPYVFLQPLKLATSNSVYNLGLGLAYQKTTIWTKIGGERHADKGYGTKKCKCVKFKMADGRHFENR